jgi:general nucleoside transport system ATP-binding protein
VNPASYLIEFKSVSKKFGNFPANDNITFGIRGNTLHSIIGENGAGKSTLMNILSGIYKNDSGNILLNGNEINFDNPLDAISNGIVMLHQHFQLIEDFTVLENVILGEEQVRKSIFLDLNNSKETLSALIAKYKLGLDPDSKVYDLSISEKQKVEILKMLYRNPDIFIFDEPTSVLSPLEVEQFYRIIRTFKTEGKTIILITHKLNEIKELSDYLTVLRKGKVVYETDAENLDIPVISSEIVGSVNIPAVKTARTEPGTEEVSLKVENIVYEKYKIRKLDCFNMEIRRNEVFGVIGIEGNGQSEIVELILGHIHGFAGRISKKPKGISVVPDDRIKKGMIEEFSIGENVLVRSSREKIFSNSVVKTTGEKIISDYDVRCPDTNSPMCDLSGGNQQKAIFGREIELDNEFMIFVHPTRGVDLNATAFIHNIILEQRNAGKAILLITADLDEALTLSDRLGILFRGRFIKELPGDILRNADKKSKGKIIEDIGKYMIGISGE